MDSIFVFFFTALVNLCQVIFDDIFRRPIKRQGESDHIIQKTKGTKVLMVKSQIFWGLSARK